MTAGGNNDTILRRDKFLGPSAHTQKNQRCLLTLPY